MYILLLTHSTEWHPRLLCVWIHISGHCVTRCVAKAANVSYFTMKRYACGAVLGVAGVAALVISAAASDLRESSSF